MNNQHTPTDKLKISFSRILPFNYPEGQPHIKVLWDGEIVTESEAKANAKLFYAAPELLEVCEEVYNLLHDNKRINLPGTLKGHTDIVGRLREAIEKATQY